MCSRHSEYGAGHVPDSDWTLTAWKVLVEDSDGGRVRVTVNAIGRNDARHLAKEKARDLGYDVAGVLNVESAA